MSSLSKTFLTPQEYLALEEQAESKSEYYAGEIFAMSGVSRPNELIAGNVFGELRTQLRGRPCEAYKSDMGVRTGDGVLFTYPDVTVACDPRFLDDRELTLINPVLIVEVLSKSTEGYDRGLKFDHYRTIESLDEYLLLSSTRMHADLYVRQADGRWLLSSAHAPEEALELSSCGCRLKLADIYERVAFHEREGPRRP